ncbi:hypothetical protein BGZ72_002980 [Mortierella alpina]|nr:hypothetical protein BGZ72_002980 [Mortierella alpina]
MRDSFPHDGEYFYIRLRDTQLVLDVSGGSTESGAEIILYTKKDQDNDNQLWSMDNKQIRNKRSGLALTFGNFAANVAGDQQDANGRDTQRFEYYDYTISAEDNENLVVGILTGKDEGARVALVHRDNDSELQQWEIIPN